MSEQQSRPGRSQAAECVCGAGLSVVELDALASALNGAFVVVVEVSGEPVQYRRRPYLSAAAAERAARRALARGQNARVYLAELKPLYRLVGGGVQ